jgi:hypothetical protein
MFIISSVGALTDGTGEAMRNSRIGDVGQTGGIDIFCMTVVGVKAVLWEGAIDGNVMFRSFAQTLGTAALK